MSRILLAVDLSYQTYRACASHSELRDTNYRFTGGLYGFLQSFGKTVRETLATDVIVCQDVKPYRRSEIYPQYKQLRKERKDNDLAELYVEAEGQVLRLCETMGLPVWGVPGFESDDLVAALVRWHRSRYSAIYAASNDSDLYQLLDVGSFSVYKDSILTAVNRDSLAKKKGLTPQQFMLATALTGTHNDIEGIKGVGEITAAKIVKDAGLLRQYRALHSALIDRNLKLIELPHPELSRALRPPTRGRAGNSRDLYQFCDQYDINCTLAMANAFDQLKP